MPWQSLFKIISLFETVSWCSWNITKMKEQSSITGKLHNVQLRIIQTTLYRINLECIFSQGTPSRCHCPSKTWTYLQFGSGFWWDSSHVATSPVGSPWLWEWLLHASYLWPYTKLWKYANSNTVWKKCSLPEHCLIDCEGNESAYCASKVHHLQPNISQLTGIIWFQIYCYLLF